MKHSAGRKDDMLRRIAIRTTARAEMVDITEQVQEVVGAYGIRAGRCTVFVPHTTAGITINEGADPDVQRDLLATLERMIPWSDNYTHMEGNAAAHVKASLVGTSQTVLIEEGELVLGTWQAIFFCEFDGPRQRQVWVSCDAIDHPS